MTLARAQLPSIIVLDREMPKIEGLKVLRMLKADPTDYMVKPFASDQVLARASRILGLPG